MSSIRSVPSSTSADRCHRRRGFAAGLGLDCPAPSDWAVGSMASDWVCVSRTVASWAGGCPCVTRIGGNVAQRIARGGRTRLLLIPPAARAVIGCRRFVVVRDDAGSGRVRLTNRRRQPGPPSGQHLGQRLRTTPKSGVARPTRFAGPPPQDLGGRADLRTTARLRMDVQRR